MTSYCSCMNTVVIYWKVLLQRRYADTSNPTCIYWLQCYARVVFTSDSCSLSIDLDYNYTINNIYAMTRRKQLKLNIMIAWLYVHVKKLCVAFYFTQIDPLLPEIWMIPTSKMIETCKEKKLRKQKAAETNRNRCGNKMLRKQTEIGADSTFVLAT